MAAKRSRSEAPEAGTPPRAGRAVAARKGSGKGGEVSPAGAARARALTAEVYNAFIAELDLVSIRLVRAQIEARSTPERRHLIPTLSEPGARYENQDGHVLVFHELGFTGTYHDETDTAVSIQAEFEVKYSSAQRMSDQLFAEFQRRNLPLNTWPYFREFVHAALARAGWPVFVLPVYRSISAPLSPADD